MNLKTKYAKRSNYTIGRTSAIDTIVMHYTANNGDTDEGNGKYFANNDTGTSAHYFVDEDSVTLSVAESDTAHHAGNWAMNCRSIGIEMCSDVVNGEYVITADTVTNAVELVKMLMKKHSISVARVIRHYDVTGKLCPKPWVEDESQWVAFKKRLEEDEMDKTTIKISINGKSKTLEGYNVEGTNYVTVRGLCDLLGVTVGYDSATKTVVLSK